MSLYAVSDLHLAFDDNRQTIEAISPRPNDWLALVGDVGETEAHLQMAFDILGPHFKQLLWTPGNHELWTVKASGKALRGAEKYAALVQLCRRYGVLTPEDDYPTLWSGGEAVTLCPMMTLYDYSYRPPGVPFERALGWAAADGVVCADEVRLAPTPYRDIVHWCAERCALTEKRLRALDGAPTVLINHFPLRHDLVWLPRIPRFSIWCGTRLTDDWHQRFNARAVVSGHLHIASTQYRNGVRFEEVSLGYPRQWRRYNSLLPFPRLILGD